MARTFIGTLFEGLTLGVLLVITVAAAALIAESEVEL